MRVNTRLDDFPFRLLVSVLIDFSTEINKVMFKNILKNCLLTAATTLVLATSAQAELQDRIIHTSNGDVKAFYDTDKNITWLGDTNYSMTTNEDHDGVTDGRMSWEYANAWANNLVVGGYSDWRLPTTLVNDDSCTPSMHRCSGGEMGHLYYSELGNTASFPTNRGGFDDLTWLYWSSTSKTNTNAWGFSFSNGQRVDQDKDFRLKAMAVMVGDVPEPETYAMLLAGLGLIGAIARRRKG